MESFKNFFVESMSYKYSCVMFKLPKKITDQILEWSEKNISEKDLYVEHKKGRVKDIHITVLYGIHTNNHLLASKIINDFNPFKIKLGKISKFQNNNFDVIKIEIKSKELKKMNKKLKKLIHTSDYPDYIPHCTLAYVKKNSCNHLLEDEYFENKIITLKDLYFTPSIGKKIKLKVKHEV